MSDSARAIVDDFNKNKWESQPVERTVAVIASSPNDLPQLIIGFVERAPGAETIVGHACEFLAMSDWPELIERSLDAIERNGEESSGNVVIAKASMQCPELLHPHLDRIFRIRPARDTYSEPWPWRDSGAKHLPTLSALVNDKSTDLETRGRAWRALIETRMPAALNLAVKTFKDIQPNVRFGKNDLDDFLHRAGFVDRTTKSLRHVEHPHLVTHIRFDPAEAPTSGHPIAKLHPTWNFAASEVTARIGGSLDSACNCCSQPLHHVITLDPASAKIGVKSLKQLTLATCLSCLGWEGDMNVAFYEHNGAGQPRDITQTTKAKPQFPSAPFRETTVQLVVTPPRWHWQDMGMSNGAQNLHRFGGHQCWVQDADYPVCPRCQKTMPFLLQLDDGLPKSDGGSHQWGAGGLGYFHWCDACRLSAVFWQCT